MPSICVFCGSSIGARPVYQAATVAMAEALVRRQLSLVYGGGQVGLMGAIADAVLAAGGSVIGVIPEFLAAQKIAHPGLTQLHIVESMHARKALMADLSDGFIALPGGYGTLEEIFEVMTWAQLGLHRKPHGLLNVAGYYDALSTFFDQAVSEAFLSPTLRQIVLEAEDPDRLLDLMAAYQPPALLNKWDVRR